MQRRANENVQPSLISPLPPAPPPPQSAIFGASPSRRRSQSELRAPILLALIAKSSARKRVLTGECLARASANSNIKNELLNFADLRSSLSPSLSRARAQCKRRGASNAACALAKTLRRSSDERARVEKNCAPSRLLARAHARVVCMTAAIAALAALAARFATCKPPRTTTFFSTFSATTSTIQQWRMLSGNTRLFCAPTVASCCLTSDQIDAHLSAGNATHLLALFVRTILFLRLVN